MAARPRPPPHRAPPGRRSPGCSPASRSGSGTPTRMEEEVAGRIRQARKGPARPALGLPRRDPPRRQGRTARPSAEATAGDPRTARWRISRSAWRGSTTPATSRRPTRRGSAPSGCAICSSRWWTRFPGATAGRQAIQGPPGAPRRPPRRPRPGSRARRGGRDRRRRAGGGRSWSCRSAEAPDENLLRAERRRARESGLIALARLNRARRDRLFATLEAEWLEGKAGDFLREVEGLGEEMVAAAGAEERT